MQPDGATVGRVSEELGGHVVELVDPRSIVPYWFKL